MFPQATHLSWENASVELELQCDNANPCQCEPLYTYSTHTQ